MKGVIRDRDEAVGMEREKRLREAEELRQLMERSSLGGKTYLEEEREKAVRGQKADELVEKELEREEERKDVFGLRREGRFGHLREAGMRGFLGAVEQEQKNVWVVVHLYEPVCHFDISCSIFIRAIVVGTLLSIRRDTFSAGTYVSRYKVPACASVCSWVRVYSVFIYTT